MKGLILSILAVAAYILGTATIFVLWTLGFSTFGWFLGGEWVSPRQWGDLWLFLGPFSFVFTLGTLAAIHAIYEDS